MIPHDSDDIKMCKDNEHSVLEDIALKLLRSQDENALLGSFASLCFHSVHFSAVDLVIKDYGHWHQDIPNTENIMVEKSAEKRWQHNVSLNNGGVIQGSLIFTRYQRGEFTSGEQYFLNRVSELAAGVLSHLRRYNQLVHDTQTLRQQCDNFHVLVDITNSVLSHLEFKTLVADISYEINRFFGIHCIAIALGKSPDAAEFELFAVDARGADASEITLRKSTCTNSIIREAFSSDKSRVMTTQDVTFQSLSSLFLLKTVEPLLRSACLLPLSFKNRAQGVLILAHDDADFFYDEKRDLLSQIAARVGIAVDNAAAYGEITDLKNALSKENTRLRHHIRGHESKGEIIYQSQAMQMVMSQVDMVAMSESNVLILGETGTGKELVAREIHQRSQRSRGPMIKINCAAVPAGLLESDLFGHEKGAFTGAITAHTGRFEMAEGGTLFLDEIGDMPLELQPKLLRVLQEREIERLGGNKIIPVDVRLVAATNRDLKQMSLDREFRSDLYYRLNVFPIYIPPLRERREDIPLLADFFMRKIAQRMRRNITSIPKSALQQLSRYSWPGNIRELENVIERAVILTQGNSLDIHLQDLQLEPQKNVAEKVKPATLLPPPEKDEDERQRIIRVLRETNGIVAGPRGAAFRLGLKRTTLLSRMQRLGISVYDL